MMIRYLAVAATFLICLSSASANADQEIALFDDGGRATAYIAVEDEMTIYLWGGEPVAYLKPAESGKFHVYGFNGSHLGWFLRGAIWDHDGDATCATKDVLRSTQYEPYKSYKQYKPYRSYQEYAPYMPSLSGSFGAISCALLLAAGGS